MTKRAKLLLKLFESPHNVRYDELYSVCVYFFGKPRQNGTSHATFTTRSGVVTIQSDSNGKAKPYQVKQVVAEISTIGDEK